MTSKEIGSRIVAAREDAGLTRKELADKVQVAASTITRYEKGSISKIKIPVIESIASVLGVNPLWIIGKSEYRSVGVMLEKAFELSSEEESLVQKYRRLSDEGKEYVMDQVDFRLEKEARDAVKAREGAGVA